ncbi:hypothetical protein Cni_G19661 [Canna indica]|uniref:Uncharacterized protein n=1 Tax=Canna indica TaxID=4628 RepID=A0AAQ3KKZ7_9LILI|nr:hypothetical protein Cni_G19661 [Canna indica]
MEAFLFISLSLANSYVQISTRLDISDLSNASNALFLKKVETSQSRRPQATIKGRNGGDGERGNLMIRWRTNKSAAAALSKNERLD